MPDTRTLRVKIEHQSSKPGWRWATPIGWEPALPKSIPEAEWVEDGTAWDSSGEELAGIAVSVYQLSYPLAHGEEVEVPLDALGWLETPSCGFAGRVEPLPPS